jgi:hypothetical protein
MCQEGLEIASMLGHIRVQLLVDALSNKRLKLTARVDCGMNLFSARRSLSAIR